MPINPNNPNFEIRLNRKAQMEMYLDMRGFHWRTAKYLNALERQFTGKKAEAAEELNRQVSTKLVDELQRRFKEVAREYVMPPEGDTYSRFGPDVHTWQLVSVENLRAEGFELVTGGAAIFLEEGTDEHVIAANNAPTLAFIGEGDGEWVHPLAVMHPGNRAYHYVRDGIRYVMAREGGWAREARDIVAEYNAKALSEAVSAPFPS